MSFNFYIGGTVMKNKVSKIVIAVAFAILSIIAVLGWTDVAPKAAVSDNNVNDITFQLVKNADNTYTLNITDPRNQ